VLLHLDLVSGVTESFPERRARVSTEGLTGVNSPTVNLWDRRRKLVRIYSKLKNYFQHQSLERARFRAELTEAVKRLGEPEPDTSGSSAAVLHRAWFELKEDFGGGDHTLLESVEQEEDSAKHAYESALETKLPVGNDELVCNQYASVKAAHDRIRSWRDEKAA
jgi:uncharacterized protein (TIGR02284 family)